MSSRSHSGHGRTPHHGREFPFKVGDLVLVKWSDGMVYFAKIKRIDQKKRKCTVVFDDKSQDEAAFSQIHSVDETTTDIICIKCKKDDSESPNEIVLCDTCGIGYHQRCHSPYIPANALNIDTPWQCTYCGRGEKCPYLTESLDALQNLLSESESETEEVVTHKPTAGTRRSRRVNEAKPTKVDSDLRPPRLPPLERKRSPLSNASVLRQKLAAAPSTPTDDKHLAPHTSNPMHSFTSTDSEHLYTPESTPESTPEPSFERKRKRKHSHSHKKKHKLVDTCTLSVTRLPTPIAEAGTPDKQAVVQNGAVVPSHEPRPRSLRVSLSIEEDSAVDGEIRVKTPGSSAKATPLSPPTLPSWDDPPQTDDEQMSDVFPTVSLKTPTTVVIKTPTTASLKTPTSVSPKQELSVILQAKKPADKPATPSVTETKKPAGPSVAFTASPLPISSIPDFDSIDDMFDIPTKSSTPATSPKTAVSSTPIVIPKPTESSTPVTSPSPALNLKPVVPPAPAASSSPTPAMSKPEISNTATALNSKPASPVSKEQVISTPVKELEKRTSIQELAKSTSPVSSKSIAPSHIQSLVDGKPQNVERASVVTQPPPSQSKPQINATIPQTTKVDDCDKLKSKPVTVQVVTTAPRPNTQSSAAGNNKTLASTQSAVIVSSKASLPSSTQPSTSSVLKTSTIVDPSNTKPPTSSVIHSKPTTLTIRTPSTVKLALPSTNHTPSSLAVSNPSAKPASSLVSTHSTKTLISTPKSSTPSRTSEQIASSLGKRPLSEDVIITGVEKTEGPPLKKPNVDKPKKKELPSQQPRLIIPPGGLVPQTIATMPAPGGLVPQTTAMMPAPVGLVPQTTAILPPSYTTVVDGNATNKPQYVYCVQSSPGAKPVYIPASVIQQAHPPRSSKDSPVIFAPHCNASPLPPAPNPPVYYTNGMVQSAHVNTTKPYAIVNAIPSTTMNMYPRQLAPVHQMSEAFVLDTVLANEKQQKGVVQTPPHANSRPSDPEMNSHLQSINKNISAAFTNSSEDMLMSAFEDAWKKFQANGPKYSKRLSKSPPKPRLAEGRHSRPHPHPPPNAEVVTMSQGPTRLSLVRPVGQRPRPAAPKTVTPKTNRACALCGSDATYLCSGCKAEWYCGRKCQLKAWDRHSESCKS